MADAISVIATLPGRIGAISLTVEMLVLASFYHFCRIPARRALIAGLAPLCRRYHCKGTIIVAAEGINANLSGERTAIEEILQYLKTQWHFEPSVLSRLPITHHPFKRLKIKYRNEIITMKQPLTVPSAGAGKKLSAPEWNNVIADPQVLTLDVRNRFESNIGNFNGAMTANVDNFSHFPRFADRLMSSGILYKRRIALYCTGGIRCEKAAQYIAERWTGDIYQLHGGIIHYFNHIAPLHSRWQGDCFVFDDRIQLHHCSIAPPLQQV